VLDRAFGETSEAEERAADPLAGGTLTEGHQCGMLWGAALAVGAESFRKFPAADEAVGAAIAGIRRLIDSFETRAGSPDCRDVSRANFKSKPDTLRYLLFGGARRCLALADSWAPEAIRIAGEGLPARTGEPSIPAVSCATELARRAGASERQAVMVAGFAGGLGLRGGGCGALGAAVCLSALAWLGRQSSPRKSAFGNPASASILKVFQDARGRELRCTRIAGRRFASVEEHAEFVRAGGCRDVLETLAEALEGVSVRPASS
jgi:hypothetical protein